MTSLASKYYQFILAQAVLQGVSMSFVAFPSLAITSKNFHRNRGLALGITVGGSSIGGLIWPIVLNELLNHENLSFGWTIRIVGFIMLPCLLLCCLSVRPSQPITTPRVSSEKHKTDLSIIKNPAFVLLCTGMAIIYLGMFGPFFYVSSYASSLGMSTSLSFYMISLLNAASLFGRVLPGFLADLYGHFNLCAGAGIFSSVIAFCWTTATNEAGVIVWSLAYGFSSGVSFSFQAFKLITDRIGNLESSSGLRRENRNTTDARDCCWAPDGFCSLNVRCPSYDMRSCETDSLCQRSVRYAHLRTACWSLWLPGFINVLRGNIDGRLTSDRVGETKA